MSQDVNTLDDELNTLILTGRAMDGFEKFYADDVVMQENSGDPTKGKDANRQREVDFFSSIEEFHGAELLGSAVTGDTSYSEWSWDLTFKNGQRVTMEQVASRRWQGGRIVAERFYYNQG